MQQEDGPASRRDVLQKCKKGGVRRLPEIRVGIGGEGFQWSSVKWLPAVSAFEVGNSNARSDAESPGRKDSGLAQELELAENLERRLLENVVGKIGAS